MIALRLLPISLMTVHIFEEVRASTELLGIRAYVDSWKRRSLTLRFSFRKSVVLSWVDRSRVEKRWLLNRRQTLIGFWIWFGIWSLTAGFFDSSLSPALVNFFQQWLWASTLQMLLTGVVARPKDTWLGFKLLGLRGRCCVWAKQRCMMKRICRFWSSCMVPLALFISPLWIHLTTGLIQPWCHRRRPLPPWNGVVGTLRAKPAMQSG